MNVYFLKSFVNLLDEFLEDLQMLFPDNDDIGAYRFATDSLCKYNPRKVLEGFMYYVAPYYGHIFEENEMFFLDLENIQKDQHFKELQLDDQKDNIMKMLEIKDMWHLLSPHNKETIWNYFKALVRNGAQASKNPEHKQLLLWIKQNYPNA